jgi:hypothetical protein
MKATNLNMIFQDLIVSYAHLVDIKPLTKAEFLEKLKNTYSLTNGRNLIFYKATEQSTFETIRLSNDRNSLLFNQNN